MVRNDKINLALLVLRVGIGIMFVLHGYPKIMGGKERWIGLGSYGMGSIGIDFFPVLWGFFAAFFEFFGGLMLIIGFNVRFFSLGLFLTMFIAAAAHISSGDGIMGASHAIELAVVFLFLFLSGGGSYFVPFNRD